jgi:phosphoglycolate phosphatase-like HAD superfamily hydrolase
MESKTYKALAFDFDGTLFDTAKLNSQAYRLAYYDLGIEITEEQFERTKGLSVYDFNRALGVDCDVERLRELKPLTIRRCLTSASLTNTLLT